MKHHYSFYVSGLAHQLYGDWAILDAIARNTRHLTKPFHLEELPRTGDGFRYLLRYSE